MRFCFILFLGLPLFATTVTVGTEETISTDSGNFGPQIAFNTAGNGIAAWVRTQATQLGVGSIQPNLVLASRYTASTALWETIPTQVGNGSSPVVGIDATNNIFVVFVDASQIKAIRYNATTAAWDSVATPLSTANNNSVPYIAVNPLGVAAVVWSSTESGSLKTSIQMAAYNSTTGWTLPTTLNIPSVSDFVGFPKVAIDNTPIATGVNGQVIWQSAQQTQSNSGQIETVPITITP